MMKLIDRVGAIAGRAGISTELFRYIVVGGTTYVVDFLCFMLVTLIAPKWFMAGHVSGRVVGALIGFVLNKVWTFGGDHVRPALVQALAYAALLLFNIGSSSFILLFLVDLLGLPVVPARVMTDVIVVAFTFVCSRIIFARQ